MLPAAELTTVPVVGALCVARDNWRRAKSLHKTWPGHVQDTTLTRLLRTRKVESSARDTATPRGAAQPTAMHARMSAPSAGAARLSARRAVGGSAVVRAAAPRRAAVRAAFTVRAEKVVGIDLGTTNSAVRAARGGGASPVMHGLVGPAATDD